MTFVTSVIKAHLSISVLSEQLQLNAVFTVLSCSADLRKHACTFKVLMLVYPQVEFATTQFTCHSVMWTRMQFLDFLIQHKEGVYYYLNLQITGVKDMHNVV